MTTTLLREAFLAFLSGSLALGLLRLRRRSRPLG
jgi:hypothetical protein